MHCASDSSNVGFNYKQELERLPVFGRWEFMLGTNGWPAGVEQPVSVTLIFDLASACPSLRRRRCRQACTLPPPASAAAPLPPTRAVPQARSAAETQGRSSHAQLGTAARAPARLQQPAGRATPLLASGRLLRAARAPAALVGRWAQVNRDYLQQAINPFVRQKPRAVTSPASRSRLSSAYPAYANVVTASASASASACVSSQLSSPLLVLVLVLVLLHERGALHARRKPLQTASRGTATGTS